MSGIADGFMRGFSFMEGIRSNRAEQEWLDTVRTRQRGEWANQDRARSAQSAFDTIDTIVGDRSLEEAIKDPAVEQKIVGLLNDFGHRIRPNGKYGTVKRLMPSGDGRIVPMIEQSEGPDGPVTSYGPATVNGTADDNDQVAPVSLEDIKSGLAALAGANPNVAAAVKQRTAADSYRAGVGVLTDTGAVGGNAGVAPSTAPVAPSPQPSAPSVAAPSMQTYAPSAQSQVPSAPPPGEVQASAPAPEPAPAPEAAPATQSSIDMTPQQAAAERRKLIPEIKSSMAAIETLAEGDWPADPAKRKALVDQAQAKLATLKQEHDRLAQIEYKDLTPELLAPRAAAAYKEQGGGARGAGAFVGSLVDQAKEEWNKPSGLVEKYQESVGRPFTKAVRDFREGFRGEPKQAAAPAAPAVPGPEVAKADAKPAVPPQVSKRTQKAVAKVDAPTSPQQVVQAQQTVATAKPGKKITDEQRNALVKMHLAAPDRFGLEDLDRVLRTGRLTKPDLKFFSDTFGTMAYDMETGQVSRIHTDPGAVMKFNSEISTNGAKAQKEAMEYQEKKFSFLQKQVEAMAWNDVRGGKKADQEAQVKQTTGRMMNRLYSTPYLDEWGINTNDPRHTNALLEANRMAEADERANKPGMLSRMFGADDPRNGSLTPFLVRMMMPNEQGVVEAYKSVDAQVKDRAVADRILLVAARVANEQGLPFQDVLQATIAEARK